MPIPTTPESEFARAVYQIVASIPAGQVASYGQIARLAGFPRHARFVGRLMGNLPAGSRLPWWRVLRSDGYPGLQDEGARRQLALLEKEGVSALGGRVSLRRFAMPG